MADHRSFRIEPQALILVFFFAGITGCASIQPESETALAEDLSRGIYCTYETTLGSSVRHKRCTTPEQREAELGQAQEMLNRPALGSAGRRGSGM